MLWDESLPRGEVWKVPARSLGQLLELKAVLGRFPKKSRPATPPRPKAVGFAQEFPASHYKRSTAGSTLRGTESRPVETYWRLNRADSVVFPASGETITSSTWRRIRTGIAALADVG